MGKFTFRLFFTIFFFSLLSKGFRGIAQVATQTFNATGANQTFVVPPCVNSVTVQAWGGAGGGGGWDTYAGSAGGGGAYATSVLAVTPGTNLTVIVGKGGTQGGPCAGAGPGGPGGFGIGNGGNGGSSGSSGCSGPGGGGGGGTGIMNGATILIVAGGGGGGGGGGNHGGGSPGGGGGQAGISGGSSAANGILGASGSTSGLNGSNAGGTDGAGGGGGGGGLVGGGGGHTPPTDNGGSGGAGGTSQGTTVQNGNAQTPGNSAFLNTICGSCADGGNGAASGGAAVPGNNGIMLISYNNPPPLSGTITNGAGSCGIATATVAPSGGTPGYTYTWSPIGGNTAASTGLTNGSYTVTIADANGCTGTASTTIVLPPALTLTATSTSVACNGLSTGSATATASGGTAPYSVGINTTPPQGAVGTTFAASGLAAGSYTMGVQDAAGCQAIFPITIAQPNPLTATTTSINVTCFGGTNGSATITPIGGTAPYTYIWSPIGGTNATANNLTAQNYTVAVTDAHNCAATIVTLAITQPALPLSGSMASTNITCNGLANGSATVTAGGGTSPYTYNWLPTGGTAATASNLTAQSYTVTITDFNLCTTTATVNITQPPALTLTATSTSVTCFGLSTGSATATASGGTAPYTIGINSTPPQGGVGTTCFAVTLPAASYTFGVQDVNGCQVIFPITITQPAAALALTAVTTSVTCFGLSTGSATATATGGTIPYLIGINSTPQQGGPSTGTYAASGLPAGSYTLGVQDANSCQIAFPITITQPALFTASITTSTNVSCFGLSDGSAVIGTTGGTAPFTYTGTNGTTIDTASNLSQGSYTLTAIDNNNCPATAIVSITQPAVLTLTASATEPTCNGLSNATATAVATGGTGPYTVGIIVPPQGGVTVTGIETFSGLAAGSYTIGVQDAHSCQTIFPITIAEPTLLTASITTSSNVSCFGLSDGNTTVAGAGGTPGYTYNWLPSGGNLATANNLAANNYTVTVSDANLCTATATVTITQPAVLTASITSSKNDSCFGDSNGNAIVAATGGTTNYSYNWLPSGGTSTTASNLAVNTYTAIVTDAHNCVASTVVTITQPNILTVSSVPQTICISQTATLSANAIGGNTAQSYTYSIAGTLGNTALVNPITTTTYTLGVIDMKGCIDTNTVTIFVRDSLKFLAVSPGAEKCNGFSTNLNATGSGGDNLFTYTWNPGNIVGQFITVSPTTTTVYTLTLTDACGTPSVSATTTVTIDPLPQISFTSDKQKGCYPLCVQFTNSTTIATADAISYNWILGEGHTSIATNPYQCYGTPGVLTVSLTATSSKGCVSSSSIPGMITVYAHPKANFYSAPSNPTILDPLIQFTDASTPIGGIGISNTLWATFGDGSDSTSNLPNPTHTYRDTGTYCPMLIVTNALGCKDTNVQCVTIKPYFTLYIPNAFSPNNDGYNDIFNAVGDYVSDFDMRIFDRWGTMIYHSTNITYGWNGNSAEQGVYVYLVHATDSSRKTHIYKGTVTLLK